MKIMLSLLLPFILIQSTAQNLVPNPSFELFNQCPYMESQIAFAQSWSNSGSGTSDYYNSCDTVGNTGVPNNWSGYQNAATGEAYCGITPFYSVADYNREFIGCTLNTPLTIGQIYYVSFKVNLCITPSCLQFYAINNLGVLFSTSPYTNTNPSPMNNFSHIHETNLILDTLNWVTIGGSFIADSAYTHLSIGNFYDPSVTDTLAVHPNSTNIYISYYLIDDVCVSSSASECLAEVYIDEEQPVSKKLVGIFDALGNETAYKPNNLLIYVYSDGSTQKVFNVE